MSPRSPSSTAASTGPLRFPLEGIAAGQRQLDRGSAHYLVRVHRLRPGAVVIAFDPDAGVEAQGVLTHTDRDGASCRLEEPVLSAFRPYPISLLQGLGKAAKPEQVLTAATALGIERVRLVAAQRSVVQLDAQRRGQRHERWKRVLQQAARQSGRGRLLEVCGPDSLPESFQAEVAQQRLVLQPGAVPLWERLAVLEPSAPLAVLIGPEGGLADEELALAAAAGFEPASLGSLVLRTELCAVAALGVLVAWSSAARDGNAPRP